MVYLVCHAVKCEAQWSTLYKLSHYTGEKNQDEEQLEMGEGTEAQNQTPVPNNFFDGTSVTVLQSNKCNFNQSTPKQTSMVYAYIHRVLLNTK